MNIALGDRSGWPDLEAPLYFNHAAMSPPSTLVRGAVTAVLDDYARRGAGAWLGWAEQRNELRDRLAALIGASPQDIALVPNTSHGVVAIATAIRWRPGERILTFRGEFPTNVTPWQRAARRFGLELVFHEAAAFATDPAGALEDLDRELAAGVRLLAVSAVQFQTGFRMPLAAIAERCRAHGTELFVDAIQAVGAVPLDAAGIGIDYLACGAHKWLMGIEGGGFVHVDPARIEALDPLVAGWLSHEDGVGFLFAGAGHLRYDRPLRHRSDVFEIGVSGSAAFAALHAATGALLELGPARIFAHLQTILGPLEAGLVDRGFASARARDPAGRSGILSVAPPAGVALPVLLEALAARGLACATPDGWLRFAPHWPNDPSQVGPVLAAVDEALAEIDRSDPV
jgi:selenocysteine lyase/cysteine desulfurase